MNTHDVTLKLITAAMLADGYGISEEETKFLAKVSKELEWGYKDDELENLLKSFEKELNALSDEDFDKEVHRLGESIKDDDRLLIFEIILGIFTADGIISEGEIALATLIAEALKLNHEELILSLVEFFTNEENKVKLELEAES